MKLAKIKSKKTRKNKNGKDVPIYYYALKSENGKFIPIKPLYNDDYGILDYLVEEVIK